MKISISLLSNINLIEPDQVDRKAPEPNMPVRLTDKEGDIVPWHKPDPENEESDLLDSLETPKFVLGQMLNSEQGIELMAKYHLSVIGSQPGLLNMSYKSKPFIVLIKE